MTFCKRLWIPLYHTLPCLAKGRWPLSSNLTLGKCQKGQFRVWTQRSSSPTDVDHSANSMWTLPSRLS
ncbi:hypothetical protein RRG08_019199 [Elysia crispata]|uniref:Uncharacterized protein n=1 Tax=Elysia crispata TaxID=231223 RepID=A0AAE1AUL6_9GAST|nr:hypothetical protein RRG08_019199 [Elysia crispata]